MAMVMTETLRGDLAALPATFDQEARTVESGVTSWEWFTDEAFELEPLQLLRSGRTPGVGLAKLPTRLPATASYVAYGRDNTGRVVFERHHLGATMLRSIAAVEAFIRYEPSRVQRVSRSTLASTLDQVYALRTCDLSPRGVTRATYVVGRYQGGSWSFEGYDPRETAFDYDAAGRLVRARYDARVPCAHEISYDADGEVACMRTSFPEGSAYKAFLSYLRMPEGFTATSVLAAIEARLVEVVPARVASLGFTDPVCLVALVYNGDSSAFLLPALSIGTATERAALGGMWMYADYAHGWVTLYDDPVLSEYRHWLSAVVEKQGTVAAAVKMLDRAAKRLNAVDWSAVLTTDDFVVTALEKATDDLPRRLKAAVPAERIARLKARGFI